MNNEEMSEMIQKLTSMMNQANVTNAADQNTEDISSYSNDTSSHHVPNELSHPAHEDENSYQDNENNFHFDFETMMKLKNMMDQVNASKNSPEANLIPMVVLIIND